MNATGAGWSLSLQPPSSRWIRGWRAGAVLIAACALAGAMVLGVDRWPLSLWRGAALIAGLGLVLTGTALVWRAAVQPRWSGITPLLRELDVPTRRAARRTLRHPDPIPPDLRRAAAILAAAETRQPLVGLWPLVVAGQQLLTVANTDPSTAPELSLVLEVLSLVVAAVMLALCSGLWLSTRRIRRHAVAAGLLPSEHTGPTPSAAQANRALHFHRACHNLARASTALFVARSTSGLRPVLLAGACAANGGSGPTRRAQVRRDGHCE